MKKAVEIFFISSIATTLLVLFTFGHFGKKKEVLSLAVEITPVPTLTPTTLRAVGPQGPEATPTPPPSPTVFLTPVPTLVPQPQYSSEEVQGFIERFSAQYGVDPNVLRHIAVCESGFNPHAVSGDYAGLYQYASGSWKTNRALMGEDPEVSLRFNAEEAVQTAAYMLAIGKGWVWPNCLP